MAEVETTTVEVESVPVTKSVETPSDEKATAAEVEPQTNGDAHTNGNGVHENGHSTTEEETATETAETNGVEKVNGEESTETEAESAVATEEGVAVATDSADDVKPAEEPTEEVPPTLKLHQFPVGKEMPSTSPFCLKVETFLKINNIPYENVRGYKMGKKGKLPFIEYNGERIADSNLILKYLKDKFEANLDGELTEDEISVGRAVRSMLEENTYWTLIFNRYVDNYVEFKKFMSQGPGGIGFNVSQKMFQRKMRGNLDGHGMGRHTKEEVYAIAEDDLRALSTVLGDKPFILGDKITSYDCTVFGLCANILYSGMDNPMKTFILDNATNVSDLCDKIKASHWSDWDEIVEGEKIPEPALKKGFSFRKKKKAPKTEAAAVEGAAEGGEDAATDAVADEKPESDEAATSADKDSDTPTEETTAVAEPTEVAETVAEASEVTENGAAAADEKTEEVATTEVASESQPAEA